MRYTPAQVKEALEISEETLRHWRKSLSPLKGKRGYSPCFSPGDLLALKVVAQFHGLGINVRQLAPFATTLFHICSQAPWFGLEDNVLVFDGEVLEMVSGGREPHHWSQQSRMVIPLGPVIRQLRQLLSEEAPRPAQPEISFPPLSVAQGRSS